MTDVVDDLLGKMSLAEKIGQLNHPNAAGEDSTGAGAAVADIESQIRRGAVGSLAGGFDIARLAELALRPVDIAQVASSAQFAAGAAGTRLLRVEWSCAATVPASDETAAPPDVLLVPVSGGIDAAAASAATAGVLEAIRQFLADPRYDETRLVALTRGAASLNGESPDPASAAAAGLLRSAAAEHPGRIVQIDLASDAPDPAPELIAAILAEGESEVAIRDGAVWIPALADAPQPTTAADSGWAADTDYTITFSTAVKDAFGVPLPAPVTVNFHTGA